MQLAYHRKFIIRLIKKSTNITIIGLKSSIPKFGNSCLTGFKTGSVITRRNLLKGSSPLGKIQDSITLPNIAIVNKVIIRSKAVFNAVIYCAFHLKLDIYYRQL